MWKVKCGHEEMSCVLYKNVEATECGEQINININLFKFYKHNNISLIFSTILNA